MCHLIIHYLCVLQQLLLLDSTSIQIPLTTPTTSQSHARTVQDVPVLPLPFISPQRTRVTLTTGPSPHSLGRPLEVEQDLLAKPRSRSTRDAHHQLQVAPPPKGRGPDEVRADDIAGKLRSASTNNSNTTIGQYLLRMSDDRSHDSKRTHVIGGRDYEPVEGMCADEWEELERRGAVGIQGSLHENFSPSVQVLDHETENSHMPFIVVNGELIMYTRGARGARGGFKCCIQWGARGARGRRGIGARSGLCQVLSLRDGELP